MRVQKDSWSLMVEKIEIQNDKMENQLFHNEDT